MDLTEGFKRTEVGVIPIDWEVKRLGSIAATYSGGTPSTKNPGFYGGEINWITSGDLNQIQVHEPSGRITREGLENSAAKLVEKDTLLVALYGATAGVTAMSRVDAAINQAVLAVIPKVDSSEFLFHWLTLRKDWIIQTYTQGGQPNLSGDIVRSLVVTLPPNQLEQRAIAAALGDVDALIGGLDALIAKKRELKQAAMQDLLTARTRLPGFSGEWEARRFGDLFAFSGGLSASRDQLTDVGYCYLHYGDIHLSTKVFIDVDAETLSMPKLNCRLNNVNSSALLNDGDIVFVDASEDDDGTSKHIVVVNPNRRPFIAGLHTIVAKDKGDVLHDLFKRYCFQTRAIKNQFRFYAVGTKVSGISKTSIAKIELRYPTSMDEQAAIATVLSDLDAEITALEARRDKTRALKRGMMQELLTGRIRLV